MPNGHDRNWVRLQASIAVFFVRYSTWPSRVRLFPGAADDVHENVFTETAFRRIIEKVTLMAGPDAAFVAERRQTETGTVQVVAASKAERIAELTYQIVPWRVEERTMGVRARTCPKRLEPLMLAATNHG